MKTLIHIGQHKTATTSIQAYLRKNRAALQEQGIFIPEGLAGHDSASHFALNIYCLDPGRQSTMKSKMIREHGIEYLDELRRVLPDEIRATYELARKHDCTRVLWSNEGLYLLNSITEHKRLLHLFAPYSDSIEIICCFRNIWAFKKSYTTQLERQGYPLSGDPASHQNLGDGSWLLDQRRKRLLLATVFTKCTYFQYDAIDNIRAFMKAIRMKPISATTEYRINTSRRRDP